MAKALKVKEIGAMFVMAYCFAWALRGYTILSVPVTPTPLSIGEAFPLDAVKSFDRAVVLVTSDKCRFSMKSVQFHQRLMDEAHRQGLPVVVVADPQVGIPVELASKISAKDQVERANVASLRVKGTPTVVLVDHGDIRGQWVGYMNPGQEETLLARLGGGFHSLAFAGKGGAVVRIADAELDAALQPYELVDLRPREVFRLKHLPQARNIPVDELGARMKFELATSKPIVLDCGTVEASECALSAELIELDGLGKVRLLDPGATGATCAVTPVAQQ
jgi:rhodanese-related sulfurtransferase